MTTQEAIDILQNTSFFGSDMDDIDTAIAMAIRSLEAWEKIKKEVETCPRYTFAQERNGQGLVEWSKYMISRGEMLYIITKHLEEVNNENSN